jgi:hypothetical protein
MPFESQAQDAWAHTKEGTEALGGPEKVKEWDEATHGKKLPKRKRAKKEKSVIRMRHTAHE